ncbi:hypothetical protein TNCV_3797191 [Trichonephila clavipes]|nr:hypothetical protein TNCV_3797191 [Trichonephila clavipes]
MSCPLSTSLSTYLSLLDGAVSPRLLWLSGINSASSYYGWKQGQKDWCREGRKRNGGAEGKGVRFLVSEKHKPGITSYGTASAGLTLERHPVLPSNLDRRGE